MSVNYKISKAQATVLEQEYVKTRANDLNLILKNKGLISDQDVRDVWFDLDVIKEYIAYVETEAEKKGITSGLGLRVYFGAYPNKGDYHNPGKSTVFFMPTQKRSSMKSNNETTDENIDGVDGLNFGMGGYPPMGI